MMWSLTTALGQQPSKNRVYVWYHVNNDSTVIHNTSLLLSRLNAYNLNMTVCSPIYTTSTQIELAAEKCNGTSTALETAVGFLNSGACDNDTVASLSTWVEIVQSGSKMKVAHAIDGNDQHGNILRHGRARWLMDFLNKQHAQTRISIKTTNTEMYYREVNVLEAYISRLVRDLNVACNCELKEIKGKCCQK